MRLTVDAKADQVRAGSHPAPQPHRQLPKALLDGKGRSPSGWLGDCDAGPLCAAARNLRSTFHRERQLHRGGFFLQIPDFLITQVREAKGVLVLGAGASAGATAGTGRTPPLSGQALAGLIAEQFLGGEYSDQPLPTVSEYAISEASLVAVQEFIKDAFAPLEPAPFHVSVPRFKWHGLATTNFDRVIEKAYEQCQKPLQKLKPVIQNGDGIEDCLRDPGCVLLLKLHGCISRTAVQECPLILTPEQYITHRAGRSHLFQQTGAVGTRAPANLCRAQHSGPRPAGSASHAFRGGSEPAPLLCSRS